MTVGEWLATRTPVPPRLLSERIERALGDRIGLDTGTVVESFLAAADEMLRECLATDAQREIALDLLAVDALVTYACEAAAESPSDLSDVAARIASRYAALGAS